VYQVKVLGTDVQVYGTMLSAIRHLGHSGHGQLRLIVKCKSMAEANRKCEVAGIGEKVFRSGWYAETGNIEELSICENTDIAFKIRRAEKTYVSIEQVRSAMEQNGSAGTD